jgi:O-antigen ligase
VIFIWFRIPEEVRSDLSMTFGLLFTDFSQGNYGGGRTELWIAAIKGAWNSDLFGIGLGNEMFFYSREQMTPWAHNLYLETLLETGLVGLVALLGVLFAFWKTCWRLWKFVPRADRPFAGALLTAFVTALINNAQEPSFWGPQYSCLFWMMMGVAYAWSRMLRPAMPSGPTQ